ncbi:flagellar motor protein MotB [Candidatus Magnetomorum sp. HK-1]|nr:flagellar motor protein MotB [Candidatus Magnetomorum sp. HK-1]
MKLINKTQIIVSIFFATFFYNQTIAAQPLTITPLFGGYILEGNRNIGNSLITGLNLEYSLSDKIRAELTYLKGDFDINYYDINLKTCVTHDGVDTNILHIGGHYHLFKYKNWTPYVSAGFGIIHMDTDYADMFRDNPDRHYQFQVNYGGGIKYAISEELAIRWDIRHLISPEHMDNDISAVMGVSYSFGLGKKEQKANVQQIYLKSHLENKSSNQGYTSQKNNSQIVEKKTVDADNDGVLDAQDICPKTSPAVVVDESGCPKDTDQDGVYDGIDRCPKTPLQVAVNIFGCSPDSDRDGIIDSKDKCADTPYKIPVDSKGCPRDKDRDGVFDPYDICPQTPYGKIVDSQGCPVLMKTLKTFRIKVEFDYKSSEVRPVYHKSLEKAARAMIQYRKTMTLIESHTDNIGSDAYNINLSNERAESVKTYLNKHFHIPVNRMKTFGFGESKPIANNETEKGRQKNRRVEITITEKIDN